MDDWLAGCWLAGWLILSASSRLQNVFVKFGFLTCRLGPHDLYTQDCWIPDGSAWSARHAYPVRAAPWLAHKKHVPGRDLCQIQGVVDRWVTFWRTARCQNNHGGGLPISAPHCCYFWGVVTPLGGWLLVVVLFWRMVSKGRAGDDIETFARFQAFHGFSWIFMDFMDFHRF